FYLDQCSFNSIPSAGKRIDSSFASDSSIATTTNVVSTSLSQSQLDAIVLAAIQRWSAVGLSQQQLVTLRAVKFEVTDLSGSYLRVADGNRIQVDRRREGECWLVA